LLLLFGIGDLVNEMMDSCALVGSPKVGFATLFGGGQVVESIGNKK
jgi:hypothetical protein